MKRPTYDPNKVGLFGGEGKDDLVKSMVKALKGCGVFEHYPYERVDVGMFLECQIEGCYEWARRYAKEYLALERLPKITYWVIFGEKPQPTKLTLEIEFAIGKGKNRTIIGSHPIRFHIQDGKLTHSIVPVDNP